MRKGGSGQHGNNFGQTPTEGSFGLIPMKAFWSLSREWLEAVETAFSFRPDKGWWGMPWKGHELLGFLSVWAHLQRVWLMEEKHRKETKGNRHTHTHRTGRTLTLPALDRCIGISTWGEMGKLKRSYPPYPPHPCDFLFPFLCPYLTPTQLHKKKCYPKFFSGCLYTDREGSVWWKWNYSRKSIKDK
jgi:hypothetical protein